MTARPARPAPPRRRRPHRPQHQLRFTVDGDELHRPPRRHLASALLANGRDRGRQLALRDRPRGIVAAGVEEPNALVKVAPVPGHVAESMLPATTVALRGRPRGRAASRPGQAGPDADDRAEYDKKYVHTDVLVVGAGPAGLAAAREAAAPAPG